MPVKGTRKSTGLPPRVVKYDRKFRVTNMDALPRGVGARYMLVFDNGVKDGKHEYIASNWLRKVPAKVQSGFVVLHFER